MVDGITICTYALIWQRVLFVILVSSLFDIDLSRFAVPIIVPSVINKEILTQSGKKICINLIAGFKKFNKNYPNEPTL